MKLNSIVPNFEADTTQGKIHFYDWLGDSWCLLFSHPADYTPVCSTELGRIAVHNHEFAKRNVKILAHSVDKLDDHHGWLKDIKSYCLDIKGDFPYPLIADPKRDLAVAFGMLDAESMNDPQAHKTVRALFIISPDRKVRLSMHYPLTCGRNVDEILRCIDSLQLTDRLKVVATPANWTPGEKIMIVPGADENEVKKTFPQGLDEVAMPSGCVYIRTTTNYK